MTQATCEHGLPPDCPLHRAPLARRILGRAVIAVLAGMDLAVVAIGALWGWRLVRATTAIVNGQP